MGFTLWAVQLVLAMTLEYDFHVHGLSELRTTWLLHTAYPLTLEQCVLFDVVVYRRANIDDEVALWAAALERLFEL